MKLLFGQAYHLRFDPKLWTAMQPFPPLGSLYAAAVAREAGYDVSLVDSMLAPDLSSWAAAIKDGQPDVVVLYEDNFNYLTKMCLLNMRETAFDMIKAAKDAGAQVVLCGSDATDQYGLYMSAGTDFILMGEGEHTLIEVLSSIAAEKQGDARHILGLVGRDPDGEIFKTDRRPSISDLDALPAPAWDLVDLEKYKKIWVERHGYFSMNMVTSRGCPYRCNWCAKPIWGRHYNVRSPEIVAAEIKVVSDLVAPDHIWFMDDIFGLRPGWVEKFAQELDRLQVHIPFKCLNRPDLLLREGVVSALKKAGCSEVWIGAESGSQKILDAMDKGTTVEQIKAASKSLRSSGIMVSHFIQFGYSGERWDDIQATIDMLDDVMPDHMGISVSYPLPGTPFYERVKNDLGNTANWKHSDDLAMLYKGTFSTGFYRKLHRMVHLGLQVRRNMNWLKNNRLGEGASPALWLRKAAGLLRAFVYHKIMSSIIFMMRNATAFADPNNSGGFFQEKERVK